MPARMTEPAVGASTCASGNQVWNGNIGTLMAKARKKARKAASCFFFQAEDGIRDRTVTGVQTCALPICFREAPEAVHDRDQHVGDAAIAQFIHHSQPELGRSEERRVGKECRSRWSQHDKTSRTSEERLKRPNDEK